MLPQPLLPHSHALYEIKNKKMVFEYKRILPWLLTAAVNVWILNDPACERKRQDEARAVQPLVKKLLAMKTRKRRNKGTEHWLLNMRLLSLSRISASGSWLRKGRRSHPNLALLILLSLWVFRILKNLLNFRFASIICQFFSNHLIQTRARPSNHISIF